MHPQRATLRLIPLGGMCEIGKNMTAYEYGNDIIIVDCGQSFPDETMPGVDAVIPDFTYVLQNRDRVRGIFLTHGHEDHIGGIPYLMKELRAPIYGGRMTMELVKYKIEDRMPGLLKSCTVNTVRDGDVIQAGCFSVEFIHVNHSIADASMLAIKTPLGYVMHSGDFKVDYTPIDGGIINLQRIAEIGRAGVLLFVCESTNIEVKGFSVSERHVGESFAGMFSGAKGRIFVATFSSNIYRLQQIFTAAERHGRKVALVGRSMLNVFNAANSLGYIQMKPDTLIDIGQIDNYPPERVVVISTGSQGEPMSALTRIAFSSHREVEIVPGDTVIISATPIPGNEKPIYKVINELYKRGAKVYYSAMADVHASGHASQEEIKLIHALVKPRYLIPAHGEYRMLYQHAELANALGMAWENIFILGNGDIFEISKGKAAITGFTNGAAVLIDGATSVDDPDNLVLRERKLLSDDGVVSVALAIDRKTGELSAPPVVHAMGFLYDSEYQKITRDCEKRAVDFVRRMKAQNKKMSDCVQLMQGQMKSFLYEKTKRRPVVMVSLIEL
ncbi:ribonuclease J [Beduinella massiliensis]|uniref:ribonuclease J n=1 Tax=Beduinella massiliensis TaxID=1852363 RepID=UPI0031F91939